MFTSFPKWLPIVLLISAIGLITGLVLHAKNAAQAQACTTTLGEIHQRLSPTFRATCAAAKSMTGISTGLMVLCGAVAAITIVVGIVRFMQLQQDSTPAG